MSELKYPIKYAILELKAQGGWLVGYEDITQGFIVSKCYVVESSIRYFSNGKNEITHKVVFPFKKISDSRLLLQRIFLYSSDKTIPVYDACGNPYPVDIVSKLFDSYEDAKNIADEKNDKLRNKCYSYISFSNPNWKEIVAKSQAEFDERMNIYLEFEQFILKETEDMVITVEEKENVKNRVKKI